MWGLARAVGARWTKGHAGLLNGVVYPALLFLFSWLWYLHYSQLDTLSPGVLVPERWSTLGHLFPH